MASPHPRLPLLMVSLSLFYVGGMYLNDAFDAQFDAQHRLERPIPSGAIRVETVWGLGFAWLGLPPALVPHKRKCFGLTIDPVRLQQLLRTQAAAADG